MHYAILAAGDGSRLRHAGISSPKPLIEVGGEPMIDRLIRIFLSSRAESIAVIVNGTTPEMHDWAGSRSFPIPFHLLVRSTAGSMESLHALSPFLTGERFIVSTVDSIFQEDEFAAFVDRFESSPDCDALMAVTGYIDDEKPLYVAVDDAMRITAFENHPGPNLRHVSGGLYGLTPAVWEVMDACLRAKHLRMRDFQREMVLRGLRVMACPFGKILDVDHPSDLAKAEEFLTRAHGNHRDQA